MGGWGLRALQSFQYEFIICAALVIPQGGDMELKFDPNGLITTVVQDANTGEVLMVAWMNAESLRLTQESGQAHFWSRSRQELWHKGATSGNFMNVRQIWVDCDADTLLLKVNPDGPACHTGARSCFFRELTADRWQPLNPQSNQ